MADEQSISGEEWRPVVGYEGLYEVSSIGRVRSIGHKKTAGHMMTGVVAKNKGGYLRVHLHRSGGVDPRTVSVHRLVLFAFVGAPADPSMQCAHLDGDPTNNRVENLIWATCKVNLSHRNAHGTAPKGSRNRNSKIGELDVLSIRARRAAGERSKDLGAEFGLSRNQVIQICSGRSWPHVGGELTKDRQGKKLADGAVAEVRRRAALGEGYEALAREFGVRPRTIQSMVRGWHRARVPEDYGANCPKGWFMGELYCYGGCGTRYADFTRDVVLPTPLWNRIAVGAPFDETQPNIDHEGRGGVLCPACIIARLAALPDCAVIYAGIG